MERYQCLDKIKAEAGVDILLLTDGYNIHHITGYRGHTGVLFFKKDVPHILTDSRYTEQVKREAPDCVCVDIGMEGYARTLLRLVEHGGKLRIGFENHHISYKQYKQFEELFGKNYAEVSWIPLDSRVESLRHVKTAAEIEKLAKAEAIGDAAFSHILTVLKEGMTEQEVAVELEYYMRRLGAETTSFDTIAASGENSSLPHAMPGQRKLQRGDFLTMDFGCVYQGYCSDMTRTVFIGDNPSPRQMEVYNTVLAAQQKALAMIRPGVGCMEVDKCARDVISEAGYGAYFGHGLGHSVGLFIHEEPRFSRLCEDVLRPGVVITVEPGIYLPEEFGVRIEDLVVVTEDGYCNLTSSPKELLRIC